jgi:hypothetical protein
MVWVRLTHLLKDDREAPVVAITRKIGRAREIRVLIHGGLKEAADPTEDHRRARREVNERLHLGRFEQLGLDEVAHLHTVYTTAQRAARGGARSGAG